MRIKERNCTAFSHWVSHEKVIPIQPPLYWLRIGCIEGFNESSVDFGFVAKAVDLIEMRLLFLGLSVYRNYVAATMSAAKNHKWLSSQSNAKSISDESSRNEIVRGCVKRLEIVLVAFDAYNWCIWRVTIILSFRMDCGAGSKSNGSFHWILMAHFLWSIFSLAFAHCACGRATRLHIVLSSSMCVFWSGHSLCGALRADRIYLRGTRSARKERRRP